MSTWYQQALTPPEVIELTIKVGVIPESDHCQAWVELKDPVANVLVGSWSSAHARWDTWPHMLDTATAKAAELLGRSVEPF